MGAFFSWEDFRWGNPYPDEKWNEGRKEYFQEILRGFDYYGFVSKQPYNGVWQLKARDELLLRKTEGMLLVYDEKAGEGSPRFYKERAFRKEVVEGYRYIAIGSDEIQQVAEESRMADW